MDIKALFKNIGKGFVAAGKFILKRVSDSQIDIAVGIVSVAAGKFIDNGQRREWAVKQLMAELKLPESLARWLVETAVLQLKGEAEALVTKAATKAKAHNN